MRVHIALSQECIHDVLAQGAARLSLQGRRCGISVNQPVSTLQTHRQAYAS